MVNHPRRPRRAATSADVTKHNHDGDYATLCASVQQAFNDAAALGPLFTTDAKDLFALYLANLGDDRQVHACSACHQFVKEFGGLVTIDESGISLPAMWVAHAVPLHYAPAIQALSRAVLKARVTGPFLSRDALWGIPVTGAWTHFAVDAHAVAKFRHALLSPRQAMAAKRADFRTVTQALADFTPAMLAEALRLLEAEALRGSEKFVAPVRWLAQLQDARAAAKDSRIRANLLWRAIVTAPEGYCHPRASVVGSLLEDIAAGLAFADIKARFNAKLHPLMYQRPQAAPSAANIAQAEKIVEQMGIASSLERRFARLGDCQTMWTPKATKESTRSGGVFGHLDAKDLMAVKPIDMPAMTMTWSKFAAAILPAAESIQMHIPSVGNFIALTAAANAEAPPILKWDSEDRGTR